jgi:hypothetical protein
MKKAKAVSKVKGSRNGRANKPPPTRRTRSVSRGKR